MDRSLDDPCVDNLIWSGGKQSGNIIEILSYLSTVRVSYKWPLCEGGDMPHASGGVTCHSDSMLMISPESLCNFVDGHRLFTRTHFVRDLLGTVNLCRAIYVY